MKNYWLRVCKFRRSIQIIMSTLPSGEWINRQFGNIAYAFLGFSPRPTLSEVSVCNWKHCQCVHCMNGKELTVWLSWITQYLMDSVIWLTNSNSCSTSGLGPRKWSNVTRRPFHSSKNYWALNKFMHLVIIKIIVADSMFLSLFS